MSLFVCPICGAALEREPGRYRCPAGHSYDVAREGYTHLLPANRKHSKMPGDDKGMAAARSVFLSKDYYAALRDALCRLALDYAPEHPAVLDTGCGEGYYTSAVYRALRDAGKAPCMAGTDISKAILRRAAKREKGRGVRRGLLLSPAGGGSVHRPAAQLLLPAGAGGISAGAPARRHVSLCGTVGKAPVGAEAGAL